MVFLSFVQPSEFWDSEDFIIYFEGHWETWEFNKDTQSVRCRGKKWGEETVTKTWTNKIHVVYGCLWCLYHLIPSYTILYHHIPFFTILYHLIPFYTILYHFIPSYTYGQMIRWVIRKQQTYLRGQTLLGITRIGRSQGYVRYFFIYQWATLQKSLITSMGISGS